MSPPGADVVLYFTWSSCGGVKDLGSFGVPWMGLGGGVARQGVIQVPPCVGDLCILCLLRAPFSGTQGLRSSGHV